MKKLVMLLFLFFCYTPIQAQRAQAIYAELGGAGLIYSVNYDTRFSKSENGFGARIGVAVYADYYLLPIHFNYLLGTGKHKFEIGAGATVSYDETIVSGALMYRFQKEDGHFLLRAGVSPSNIILNDSLVFDPAVLLYPGISVGYKF